MAKSKLNTAGRTIASVLADVKEANERLGDVAHFLRIAEMLFESIREDHPNLKAIAAKVEEAHRRAVAAYEGSEG